MDKCADLNTLQVWAGYLSWLGFFKTLAVCILVAGAVFLCWGILTKLVHRMRLLLEACGYVLSLGLIASGGRVPDEYLVWTVFAGCLLLLATVCATILIHDIAHKDLPRTLAAGFAVIWGAVAVWYGMTEVGFLAMLALMNLLGFQFGVGPFSYWFGFRKDKVVPAATYAAFTILAAFVPCAFSFPTRRKPSGCSCRVPSGAPRS